MEVENVDVICTQALQLIGALVASFSCARVAFERGGASPACMLVCCGRLSSVVTGSGTKTSKQKSPDREESRPPSRLRRLRHPWAATWPPTITSPRVPPLPPVPAAPAAQRL